MSHANELTKNGAKNCVETQTRVCLKPLNTNWHIWTFDVAEAVSEHLILQVCAGRVTSLVDLGGSLRANIRAETGNK